MANPRLDRLRNDYQRLQQLAARSPYLHIMSTQGNPPTEYTIQFTCRGVETLDDGGRPIYREDHRVRITLGPTYPNTKPDLAWLTPIFHPNISGQSVCIGNEWKGGGRYLDDLTVFLMQMVRYDGENLAFSANAYNARAYQWAVSHRNLLPVDKRPMFGPSLGDSIRVISSSQTGSAGSTGSLNINVLGGGNLDIRVQGRN